eukprot:s2831_g3.t1
MLLHSSERAKHSKNADRFMDPKTFKPKQRDRRCTGGRRLGLSEAVMQMSVGVSHAAFLTKAGEVYCLGRNSCGECGVDPAVRNVAATCTRVRPA